jgi:uncharacterized protein YoxC
MSTIFYAGCIGIITLCVIFLTVYVSCVLQRLNRILSDIEEVSNRTKRVSKIFSSVFTLFDSIKTVKSFFHKKEGGKCQKKQEK